jgi:hypothetical protein
MDAGCRRAATVLGCTSATRQDGSLPTDQSTSDSHMGGSEVPSLRDASETMTIDSFSNRRSRPTPPLSVMS